MALFNSMGNSSSPLFITGNTVPALDPSALQYYAAAREKADEKLALKLAAERPNLEDFDKKMEGLAGDKNYLHENYKQSLGKVTQGVNKYGGLWAVYANTPEGKQDIARVGTSIYDAQVASDNFKIWHTASQKVSKENLGAQRWLDNQTFTPTGTKGKIFNNQDYLNYEAENPTIDPETGRLKQKDLQILETGSQILNKELQDFYTTVGSTEWSTLSEGDQKMQNVGAYAYNTLTRYKSGGKSNKAQLDEAGKVLYENLSDPSKGTLWNEIYDMAEGKRTMILDELMGEKVNLNKLYSDKPQDQDYRTSVMQRYMAYRVKQAEAPFAKTGSERAVETVNMGRAEGFGPGDTPDIGFIGHVNNGDLIPTVTQGNKFYYNPATGKYVPMTAETQVFGGTAAIQGLEGINKAVKAAPQTLGSLGVKGFVYGDNAHTVDNPNEGFANAQILSFDKVIAGDKLIFDPTTKQYRNPTVQEKQEQQRIKDKQIAGATLTPEEEAAYYNSGQYFYSVKINLGEDGEYGGDKLMALKHTDGKDKKETAVDDVMWMGEDIDNENVVWNESEKRYETTILVPVEYIDVGTGNNDKEIQAGYQFQQMIKAAENAKQNVQQAYDAEIYNQMKINPPAAAVNAQYR